jgi:hypothetical protein
VVGRGGDGHFEHLSVLLAVGDIVDEGAKKDSEQFGFDDVLAQFRTHRRKGGHAHAFQTPLPEKAAALTYALVVFDPGLEVRAELHLLDVRDNLGHFRGSSLQRKFRPGRLILNHDIRVVRKIIRS